jgi:hypothetical protein
MRNVKAKVIPIIIAANGTFSKSLRKYLSNIPGNHEVKNLQSAAIADAAHILRKVRMYKNKTYFTCEITLHVAQIVSTEQLQHYIPYKHGLFVL